MKNKKTKKCLHIVANKKRYTNGESIECRACKTVLRFTDNNGKFYMFPNGGSMTKSA